MSYHFRPENWSRTKLGVACLLGLLLIWLPQPSRTSPILSPIQDFTGFYVGATLVGTAQLYDVDANLAVQKKLVTETRDSIIFVRLPYFASLLHPLVLIPFRAAVAVWKGLLLLALGLFVLLFPVTPLRLTLLAVCYSIPAGNALLMGQDSPWVILWIALSLRLYVNGNRPGAGLLLSLCAEKWHLFVLLPLLLVAQREWKVLQGLVLGSLVILATCFMIQGPDFLNQYYRALTLPNMNALPWLMPNIEGAFWFLAGAEPIVVLPVSVAIAVLTWSICRSQPFQVGMAACIIGGLLVSPHDYLHDWTIALPALLILYSHVPATKNSALLLASPVLGWIVVPASIWLGFAWMGCLCIVITAVWLLWTVRESPAC